MAAKRGPRQTNGDHCFQTSGSTDRFDFADGPGLFGFMSDSHVSNDRGYIDDLTIKTDTDGNGSYETTEHVDHFDLNSDDNIEDSLEYDDAGNLTYDGNKKYTYDAFNRLVKVEKAFKDASISSGALQTGSTIAEYQYDAANRRIRKDAYVTGEIDQTEHFYCIGGSLIETRNGSDQVTQQHVWDNLAGHYIDSLAQVANNANPGVDDDGGTGGVQDLCEDTYYALQDQQFNVLAITDDTGAIVERYEYTLYGERTVMSASYAVIGTSAYAMNCGFQGLYHDLETGLIYNRARMLNSRLGRFNQRDPLGYPDGMNTYAAYHVMYGGVDPTGMHVIGVMARSDISISRKRVYKDIVHNILENPSAWWFKEKTRVKMDADFMVSVKAKFTIKVGIAGKKAPPYVRGGPSPSGRGPLGTIHWETDPYWRLPSSKIIGPVIEDKGVLGLAGKACRKVVYLSQKCCLAEAANRSSIPEPVRDDYFRTKAVYLYGQTIVYGSNNRLGCDVGLAENQLQNLVDGWNNASPPVTFCGHSTAKETSIPKEGLLEEATSVGYGSSIFLKEKLFGGYDVINTVRYVKGQHHGIMLYTADRYIVHPNPE